MVKIRLCDCIKCVPDPLDDICLRCVDEQYKFLIETIDDSIDVDDSWLFVDDDDYIQHFDYD